MRDELADFLENNNGIYGGSGGGENKDDQGDMSFCMSNYARETMKNIFMMRSHHMLTDVVLEVQQELFHAHKVILSAASPYFKAMFTGGLKECEMSRIKLQGVRISRGFDQTRNEINSMISLKLMSIQSNLFSGVSNSNGKNIVFHVLGSHSCD